MLKAPMVERCRALTLYAESPDTGHAARGMVRSALEDWELTELVPDACLVVSELVGNVVHHAVPDADLALPGAPRRVDIRLTKWPKWLFLGVSDEDSTAPGTPMGDVFSPLLAGVLPEAVLPDSGRGLMIVQRLTDALWWAPDERGGKTVVCRFDLCEIAAHGLDTPGKAGTR
ncbi:ATPase/histidine kinase/DNA gyrase B/HSP90 domain protein [Streptomyces eurocidicus]|uniref:ATPase/histidine kinase/DNA gyrase B/HSP90 domain protein n=2 Tax=Streptomyces eurocidicus TaxID=66423 RepID=A0A2N8NYZ2_STREU|nr:ATPase/histidine kinase/DNA gyrase B/HSP90 domain protein [Streptomyces eurocidicus]